MIKTSRLGRRSFLRWAGGAAAAGVVGVGGVGCRGLVPHTGSGNAKDLSISWWAEGTLSNLHLDVLKQYQASHDGVTVQPQYQPLNGYDDKLSTELAGGNAPDIFQLRRQTFAEYISRGAVRQLDDLVPGTLPFDRLPEVLQAAAQYKGHWYAIPLGLATAPAVIGDKVVLRSFGIEAPKADWTLADFESLLRTVHKRSGGRYFGSTDMSGSEVAITAFLAGADKLIFTDDGRPGFSRDDLSQWWQMWDRFRQDGLVPPMKVTAAGKGFTTDPLVKGTSAITLTASSKGINGLQPLVKHELELFSFPRRSEGGPTATSVGPIEWFALSSKLDGVKAQQAADLAMFFVDNAKAIMTLNLAHGVPLFTARRRQTYDQQSKINKLLYDNVQQINDLGPAPVAAYPPGASELIAELSNQNQLFAFGKVTLDQAVDAVFAAADRLL
ncbi:MAG TPA: ABC transporter substrate-binding protein [Microlunatus sp.]